MSRNPLAAICSFASYIRVLVHTWTPSPSHPRVYCPRCLPALHRILCPQARSIHPPSSASGLDDFPWFKYRQLPIIGRTAPEIRPWLTQRLLSATGDAAEFVYDNRERCSTLLWPIVDLGSQDLQLALMWRRPAKRSSCFSAHPSPPSSLVRAPVPYSIAHSCMFLLSDFRREFPLILRAHQSQQIRDQC